MDYRLLPDNWVIEACDEADEIAGIYNITLRNVRTTEAVFAYAESEEEAFSIAVEAAKEMRTT